MALKAVMHLETKTSLAVYIIVKDGDLSRLGKKILRIFWTRLAYRP